MAWVFGPAYRGATVRHEEVPLAVGDARTDRRDWAEAFKDWNFSDLSFDAEGCLGLLAGLLVGLLVLLGIVLIGPLVLEGVVLLFAALAWLFSRALRQVFRHADRCHGRLAASAGTALFYTTFYTGWLFALVQLLYLWRGAAPA